jgi:O-antigen/teichoic acid export membrane protein
MRTSLRISILMMASAVSAGATFVQSMTLGRVLGSAALGTFALVTAVARIIYAAGNLGVNAHLTRAVSRDPSVATEAMSLFVSFRVLMMPAAVVTAVVAVALLGGDDLAVAVFVTLALGVATVQMLYEALFLAFHDQRSYSVLTIISSGFLLSGCGLWVLIGAGDREFALTYLAAAIGGCAAWWRWAAVRLGVHPRPLFDRTRLRRELSRSWPIGLSGVLAIASLKVPVIVMGVFGTPEEVGAFAAADLFVTASGIIQGAVTNATFPRLSSAFRTDPVRYRRVFWLSNALIAGCGILIGGFLAVLGGPTASLVFASKDFGELSRLLTIMGWTSPALLLVHHNMFVFAAADRERANPPLMAAWFVAIAGCQLALVPRYGAIGAAWGLLVGRYVGLAIVGLAWRELLVARSR